MAVASTRKFMPADLETCVRNCSFTSSANWVKLVVLPSQANCVHVLVEGVTADKLCPSLMKLLM